MRKLCAAMLAILAAGGTAGVAADADAPDPARDFRRHCAACHGLSGGGDGPAADALTPRPLDLTRLAADNGGSFPETLVYQVIDGRRIVRSHGSLAMPVWGHRFASEGAAEDEIDARIGALIDYIESLQRPAP